MLHHPRNSRSEEAEAGDCCTSARAYGPGRDVRQVLPHRGIRHVASDVGDVWEVRMSYPPRPRGSLRFNATLIAIDLCLCVAFFIAMCVGAVWSLL